MIVTKGNVHSLCQPVLLDGRISSYADVEAAYLMDEILVCLGLFEIKNLRKICFPPRNDHGEHFDVSPQVAPGPIFCGISTGRVEDYKYLSRYC